MKLTKNALRSSQGKLRRLERYLPTLQLKKGLLQQEVFKARADSKAKADSYASLRRELEACRALYARARGIDFSAQVRVSHVDKGVENIAGIDLPTLGSVSFEESSYSLFDTQIWVDSLVHLLRRTKEAKIELDIAHEREGILARELRSVTIRVNLFEKIMIPRTREEIKTIRVFLSDQELMAVARAKAAQKRLQSK